MINQKFPKKKKILCPKCKSSRISRIGKLAGNMVLWACRESGKDCGHFTAKHSKSKLKNESDFCRQEHLHKSRDEARACDDLYLMKADPRQGIKAIYKEKCWDLHVNGKKVCEHYVDWTVEMTDGSTKVIDFKGFSVDIWRLKHKMFVAEYPNVPYEVWRKKK